MGTPASAISHIRNTGSADSDLVHHSTPRSAGRSNATNGMPRWPIRRPATRRCDRRGRWPGSPRFRPRSTPRSASNIAVPVVTVSSTTATASPGATGPTRRPPAPWSFASLRIEKARKRRPACGTRHRHGHRHRIGSHGHASDRHHPRIQNLQDRLADQPRAFPRVGGLAGVEIPIRRRLRTSRRTAHRS